MSSHDPGAGFQAVPGAILALLIIVVLYGLPWLALLERLRLAQRRRQVGWLQSDGSASLFALRVLVFGMTLFPLVWIVISTRFTIFTRQQEVSSVGPLTVGDGPAAALCALAAMLVATVAIAFLPRASQRR